MKIFYRPIRGELAESMSEVKKLRSLGNLEDSPHILSELIWVCA